MDGIIFNLQLETTKAYYEAINNVSGELERLPLRGYGVWKALKRATETFATD